MPSTLTPPKPISSLHSPFVVPVRPPLKWAGGKRWQLPHLQPIFDQHRHRRLVEPFCGGLAVALGLLPREALLNDINPHVINLYRQIKKGLRITIEMANRRSLYYRSRTEFNELITKRPSNTPRTASLFYYLNRTGYNGLCRFNQQGGFNVPFGKYSQINYTRDFQPYKSIFANWKFLNKPFDKVPLSPDDFVYADPPYDVEFTQYAKDGFTWDDQVRTAEWLAAHPGPVVLSNQATPRIVALYRRLGFRLKFLTAPRMISCNGDRTPAKEVLALRNV